MAEDPFVGRGAHRHRADPGHERGEAVSHRVGGPDLEQPVQGVPGGSDEPVDAGRGVVLGLGHAPSQARPADRRRTARPAPDSSGSAADTLDHGQPGLRLRFAHEIDRERLGLDAADVPAVAERGGDLGPRDPARAHSAGLPVAEAQQVAGRPRPHDRRQAGHVPDAVLVIEHVEHAAVHHRVEHQVQLAEVQHVGDLEPGRAAPLGRLAAGLRDGGRRGVHAQGVSAVRRRHHGVLPGSAARIEQPPAEQALIRQPGEHRLRPPDVPRRRLLGHIHGVPLRLNRQRDSPSALGLAGLVSPGSCLPFRRRVPVSAARRPPSADFRRRWTRNRAAGQGGPADEPGRAAARRRGCSRAGHARAPPGRVSGPGAGR